MNLHEFQAKDILTEYDIPMPQGRVAATAAEAEEVALAMNASRFAVKAQVHAGGRGKAGGVRLVNSPAEVRATADELIGMRLVTDVTGPEGRSVRRVYVEQAVEPERLLYVGVLVDRPAGAVTLIGAEEGGEDIEDRAASDPGIIKSLVIGADGKADPEAYETFAKSLALRGELVKEAARLFSSLVAAFVELDASLIEINPLAITLDNKLVALDVKMVLDDNALFRHPDLSGLRDKDDLDPVELEAQANQINFIRMDGNVGIVVNGAGLALATNDMLRDAGGNPANFMDIRTTASSLDIAKGFSLLLDNPNVRTVLVNVHGGGMQRCDTIAEGIGVAMKRQTRSLPIIVRFAGNNANYGITLLKNYGVNFVEAEDMSDAVDRALASVGKEAA